MRSREVTTGVRIFRLREIDGVALRRKLVVDEFERLHKTCIRTQMPCGRTYTFGAFDLPLETTECGCGDPLHRLVVWECAS